MWGCVQPARGGGGTHSYTCWGTNMESLLGGFRAPREGRTVNTPTLRRGSRMCLSPYPRARQRPDQAHSGVRPEAGPASNLCCSSPGTPGAASYIKSPLSRQSVGC